MSVGYKHDHENEITLFAETNFRNQRRRFGIKTDDRRRHIYIIGKTGMGKTTLMENMVLSDINAGHGVCYVDPHGDTAEKILDYIPSHRINDVVYFNPADVEYPVGFNILEAVDEEKKHLVASGLMGVFKKIWPDVWSARMEYILQNCVLALLDYPGATLLGINRLLVDIEYRKRVIVKIRDPIVKTFWVAEFSSWSEKYATEAIAPVQNKVGQFLSASVIRNIVAQVKSMIDPRRIMDEGKILIVNLSKGKIGEDNMRLLGGMMITKIQMAAMERVDIKNEVDRRDFYLYVDEFQNFANQSFASILSEARKYRLNLVVAHQYIKQLEEEVAWAIFGNVGTIVSFRVGAEDAEFMENEFTPTYTIEDLVNLTKYQVYLKLMVDGVATAPFSANTLAPIAQRTGSEAKIVAVSRERYASPRSVIQEKVLRWSGMEVGVAAKVGDSQDLTEQDHTRTNVGNVPASIIHGASEHGHDVGVVEGDSESEREPVEYLKISEERLASIVKSPQGKNKKKDKPQFPHTCTRCGKVWNMPIQLDPTRPMYCSECLPLVKEDRQAKTSVMKSALHGRPPAHPDLCIEETSPTSKNESKLRETFALSEEAPPQAPHQPISQNRPRILGTPQPFPQAPQGTVRITNASDGDEDSLLASLVRSKGSAIETNKDRLTEDTSGGEFGQKITAGKHSSPNSSGKHHKKDLRTSKKTADPSPSAKNDSKIQRQSTPQVMPQSVTVFKNAVSAVRSNRPPQSPPAPAPAPALELDLSSLPPMDPLNKIFSYRKQTDASGHAPHSAQTDNEGH